MFCKKKKKTEHKTELFDTEITQESNSQYGCAAVNRSKKNSNDIIETPEWLYNEIFSIIEYYYLHDCSNKYLEILDPCCGNCNLMIPFKESGFKHITEFDISTGQDFFDYPIENRFDVIVMNPPFSKQRALKFIKKALLHLNLTGIIACIVPLYLVNNGMDNAHFLVKHVDWMYHLPKNTFTAKGGVIHTALMFLKHEVNRQHYLFDPQEKQLKIGKE